MTRLRFLTAGESHGPCLTAIVEGLPAGLAVDEDVINHDLRRRQGGYGRGRRQQIEHDRVQILGGVLSGRTIGAPVALQIENRDWANWREHWEKRDLPKLTVPRPGHADYSGMVKYGLTDARLVLERASARGTGALVAAGGLARLFLAEFGVLVGSYVTEIGGVVAQIPDLPVAELWALAEASDVGCPDEDTAARIRTAIDDAREAGESLGGCFVVTATGVPIGLGSHAQWDRRLNARLAAAVMGIQAIKGIEVGPAFENARRLGTQVHDEFLPAGERPEGASLYPVTRATNRAGGIEGGMSNGQPIVLRAAMKPIPTTVTPLRSVDLVTGERSATHYQRSDVCAVPAASIVGEAMVAWVLADALLEKYGGDSMAEIKARMDTTP
jgi:chorismate synthase